MVEQAEKLETGSETGSTTHPDGASSQDGGSQNGSESGGETGKHIVLSFDFQLISGQSWQLSQGPCKRLSKRYFKALFSSLHVMYNQSSRPWSRRK